MSVNMASCIVWLFTASILNLNEVSAQGLALSANTMGSVGGRFINAAFFGAFHYEPWPRHYAHLYLGCYTAMPGDFDDSLFRPLDKYVHTLVAKKDETIPFELCWRQCTYKVGGEKRNKVDFVGLLGNNKLCVCLGKLFEYQQKVSENSCSAKCTDTPEQTCEENTMRAYLVCYPGFYRAPFCDTQCPSGVCVSREFPDTQFANFHVTACTQEGKCFKRCIGSDSLTCRKLTERCRVISGDREEYVVPRDIYYNSLQISRWVAPSTARSYILLDRMVKKSPHEGTVHGYPFLTGLVARHGASGSAFFLTVTEEAVLNANSIKVSINFATALQDLGYPRTDMFYFHQFMSDEYGGKLVRWDQDGKKTYIALMHPQNTQYIKVFHAGTEENNKASMYAYANVLSNRNIGTKYILTDCGLHSACRTNQNKANRPNLRIDMYISEAYVCMRHCFQQRCTCNGLCLYGCRPGLMGPKCDQSCDTSHYGLNCRYPCSPGCSTSGCDSVTGECLQGCIEDGITGLYCTETCSPGTYGLNCAKLCSPHCVKAQECSGIDGKCKDGCVAGYQPPLCITTCEGNTYGKDCSHKCGTCKDDKPCDIITGECLEGCSSDSLSPPHCLCEKGYFGSDCSQGCGQCKEGMSCESEAGICVKNATDQIEFAEQAVVAILENEQVAQLVEMDSCTLDAKERTNCGESSKEECIAKECCYDDSDQADTFSCYYKKTENEKATSNREPSASEEWKAMGNGLDYLITTAARTFNASQKYCQELGGDLIHIANSSIDQWLTEHLVGPKCDDDIAVNSFYIGLTTSNPDCGKPCEKQWTWTDGSPTEWTNWHPDSPAIGHDAVRTCSCKAGSYKWRSILSSSNQPHIGAICQRTSSSLIDVYYINPGPEEDISNETLTDTVETEPSTFDPSQCKENTTHENETCVVQTATGKIHCFPKDCDFKGTIKEAEVQEATESLCKALTNMFTNSLVPLGPREFISDEESMCASDDLQSPSCICKKGFYGEDCDKKCGNCAGVQCFHDTGDCGGICLTGFLKPNCKESCPSNSYGDDCMSECGHCSGGSSCSPFNGECKGGCKTGYVPPLCVHCEDMHYGENCEFTCGSCLGAKICDSATGHCLDGCMDGKNPPFCKCPSGYYGENCDILCGHCKDEKGCRPDNGACLFGCAAGFTGMFCNDTCEPYFFGQDCSLSCGHCFNSSMCQTVEGNCPEGCAGGFRPPTCLCKSFTYGDGCKPCGRCANGTECDAESGACTLGCEPGFRSPDCKCRSNQWGDNCKANCGHCANDEPCDLVTGHCPNDCKIGYTGKFCTDVCPFGFYGKNCSEKCGHCKKCQTCDPFDGKCECAPGYAEVFKCQLPCSDGSWGNGCFELCGRCVNSQPCRKTDGKCLNGCVRGFQPPTCWEQCDLGFWGANCLSKCGYCDGGYQCSRLDGLCQLGCQANYKPPLCIEQIDEDEDETLAGEALRQCPNGLYGPTCEHACGRCIDNRCDTVSGLCLSGCRPGYKPLYCTDPCEDGFYGPSCIFRCGHCFDASEICRKSDGLCRSGCGKGWYGRNCAFETQEKYDAFMLQSSASTVDYKIFSVHLVQVILGFLIQRQVL